MEDALALVIRESACGSSVVVLILVVMEDALAHARFDRTRKRAYSLNPCCNGRCTRTC